MNLTERAKNLVAILKHQHSSEQQINESISKYYQAVKQTQSDEEVGQSMQLLCEVFSFDHLKNGSIASLVCGNLIEYGFPAEFIIDDFINFFTKGIEASLPFIQSCEEEFLKENDGEESEFELIERKKEELKPLLSTSIQILEGLDLYYPCGIAIFSSGIDALKKGKNSLSTVSAYSHYNNAFYWFSKLFEVLYNEKVLVIDLNSQKGFKGRISGIVDNFQLQILLMGLPELNETILLHKKDLDVVKGLDVQQLNKSISGKWNMYNWEYLKENHKDNSSAYPDSKYWIWGEGIPNDISKFNDYRVILLDKPSYSRSLPIQRTFKNLKAAIKVDEKLNKSQIEEQILAMKNKAAH